MSGGEIMAANPIIVGELGKIATESIKVFGEYMQCKEIEKTERARIRAALQAITQKIEADKEEFLNFIEKSFHERENLYKRADKVLCKAIEDADQEMVKLALNFMATVYHKNPLDGFDQSKDYLSGGIKNYLK